MCQCPYGPNFISTIGRITEDYEKKLVSMPLRAKLHFYRVIRNSRVISQFVSMPLRAKLHFYVTVVLVLMSVCGCVNALTGQTSFLHVETKSYSIQNAVCVSMPLRAKLHFYPTPQKPFIYAVYFPYFRTYFSEYSENSPFQGHFYVLPFFSSSLIEFHLLCNDIFSFLFSILIQFPFAVNTPYSFL